MVYILLYGHEKNCADISDFAGEKIVEIEAKIRDFNKICDMLKDLTQRCSINEDLTNCPIIESFKN